MRFKVTNLVGKVDDRSHEIGTAPAVRSYFCSDLILEIILKDCPECAGSVMKVSEFGGSIQTIAMTHNHIIAVVVRLFRIDSGDTRHHIIVDIRPSEIFVQFNTT